MAGSPGSPSTENLEHFIDIPEVLFSRETLTFLGFNESASETIWSRWVNCGPDDGREIDGGLVTFESMARAYIYGTFTREEDASSDDDLAWRASMNSCGINEELQTAIMTPRCRDVRLTESCQFWLLDTISARYASLKQIQAASFTRSARQIASHPGVSSLLPGEQMPSQYSSTSEMLYGAPGMSPMVTSAPEVRVSTPGHTVLYRGGYATSINPIFDDAGQVAKITPLFSGRPGDFNSMKKAISMVLDFEIAHKYAYWSQVRDGSRLAVILRLEIPNSALESMDGSEKCHAHWPSQEWKELVWNCRRNNRLQHNLAKFGKATLAIGTICSKPNIVVTSLPGPVEITHQMVLQGQRGDAVQYVFIDDQGVEFLETHGSATCSVHPMTRHVVEQIESGMN
ncbi:hypothetical protein BKA56DRAFT_655924 [Ilyonectria sp. MPI-CAGE-AT-0026]|nr:hypothetical protein BKA56DRAFT_655924 [Ilyonectria sp. MPI-CAGE-AT-0026]